MRGWPGVTMTVVGRAGVTGSGGEQRRAIAVAAQSHTRMSPRCCGRGLRRRSPKRGSKSTDGCDRAILGGQPANEQRRRHQRAGDVGDHRVAERQAAMFSAPRGLQAGGARPVAAHDDGRFAGRTQPERPGL